MSQYSDYIDELHPTLDYDVYVKLRDIVDTLEMENECLTKRAESKIMLPCNLGDDVWCVNWNNRDGFHIVKSTCNTITILGENSFDIRPTMSAFRGRRNFPAEFSLSQLKFLDRKAAET